MLPLSTFPLGGLLFACLCALVLSAGGPPDPVEPVRGPGSQDRAGELDRLEDLDRRGELDRLEDPDRAVPSELRGRVTVEIGDPQGEVRPYRFLELRSMALGPDGRLYLSEARTGEIRAFNAEGRHDFTVDPRMEGPVPFREIRGILFDQEGRLWVESNAGRDVLVLDGDRTVDRTRIPRADLSLSARRVAGVARVVDGRVVVLGVDPERREEVPAPFALLSVAASGEARPLHPVPGVSGEGVPLMVMTHADLGRAGRWEVPAPFSGRPLSAVSPDGTVASLRTDRYEILRTGPDGDRLPLVSGPPVEPVPVTEGDREQFVTSLRRGGYRVEGLAFPEAHPPVLAMAFDAAGRLWVELTQPSGSAERVAHVLGTDGSLLHVARWPAEVSLLGGPTRPLLLEDRAWGTRPLPGHGHQVIRIDWEG